MMESDCNGKDRQGAMDRIRMYIETAEDVLGNTVASNADMLGGILAALTAQAKIQLLAIESDEEDRAVRREQMNIGKSMLSMFSARHPVVKMTDNDGDKVDYFTVTLSNGDQTTTLATDDADAIWKINKQLEYLDVKDVKAVSAVSCDLGNKE